MIQALVVAGSTDSSGSQMVMAAPPAAIAVMMSQRLRLAIFPAFTMLPSLSAPYGLRPTLALLRLAGFDPASRIGRLPWDY